jgi:hypothetical protein
MYSDTDARARWALDSRALKEAWPPEAEVPDDVEDMSRWRCLGFGSEGGKQGVYVDIV